MALIDKASLLMVPSTYEEGTLYNVLPSGNRAPDSTDQNSGYDQTRADFTFDRGSNAAATRIGSDGLIKKYRENLLLQSNQFDTTWVNANSSETSGQADKDGGTDAWKIDLTGVSGRIYQSKSQSGVVTFSVYAKKGTLDWVILSSNIVDASFNLSTGEKGTLVAGIASSIEDVGGGWYRCSCTGSGAFTQFRVYPAIADNTFTGTSGNIYIQNAQVETGLVATDYLDSGATTAKAGVLIDLPRINYDANGENGSLLLEPSRQQLLQYSEYFDGSGWNKTSGGTGSTPTTTINTNETLSPEGVYNATKIVFDSGSGTTTGDLSLIEGVVSIAAGTDASTSIWLKGENGGEQLHMRGVSNGSFSIITLTTEWQQFTTSENSSTTTDSLQFGIRQNVSGLGIINSNATIYAYGAQIELGSYATSYIPNHGESGGVTRAADSCLDGGSAESINSTEGVLYAEISALADDGTYRILSINDGTRNERVYVQYTNASNTIAVVVKNGNTTQANISHTLTDETKNAKVAFKYKANDFALYINGSQIGTDTSGSTPVGLNNFSFDQGNGANFFYGNVKQVAVFNEALSDSELATLTTL